MHSRYTIPGGSWWLLGAFFPSQLQYITWCNAIARSWDHIGDVTSFIYLYNDHTSINPWSNSNLVFFRPHQLYGAPLPDNAQWVKHFLQRAKDTFGGSLYCRFLSIIFMKFARYWNKWSKYASSLILDIFQYVWQSWKHTSHYLAQKISCLSKISTSRLWNHSDFTSALWPDCVLFCLPCSCVHFWFHVVQSSWGIWRF